MLVLTSEQRVGSRWIGYLLGDLFSGKKSTPEINLNDVENPGTLYRQAMNSNRVFKIHGNPPLEVVKILGPQIKLLGIVRDPRDRLVSLSFHKRYHLFHDGFIEKKRDTELEALQYTVMEDGADNQNNYKMLEYMISFHSTRALNKTSNYVWTTYEWLKEDTYGEITKILDVLGLDYFPVTIEKLVEKYSFKNLTGRNPGEEDRKDTFARKGIVGDWKEWFTPEMLERTEEVYSKYYEKINLELGNSNKK